jgi:hypothetical protein
MQHVPARAGLVGEHQSRGFGVEPADPLVDVRLAGADGADEVRGIPPSASACATAIESL